MENHVTLLSHCPLFDGIAHRELEGMLGCLGAVVRDYSRRQTILAEGDPARSIGIVLSGSAQIEQVDYYGNRTIVGGAGPGELFGESFACAQVEALPVSVMAGEGTQIMLIACRRITNTCSSACAFHQRMIYNLMKVTAMKNLIFHQRLQITSKRTTREKLMAYLMMQAKQNGSNRFRIPFDRQELADYLAVDRSGLSAEIGKLCRQGVIKSNRSCFELL